MIPVVPYSKNRPQYAFLFVLLALAWLVLPLSLGLGWGGVAFMVIGTLVVAGGYSGFHSRRL